MSCLPEGSDVEPNFYPLKAVHVPFVLIKNLTKSNEIDILFSEIQISALRLSLYFGGIYAITADMNKLSEISRMGEKVKI